MTGRLRLCFVSLTFSPWVGGSEVQAEKQARHLQALGHKVVIATLRYKRHWKRAESLNGLPVVRTGGIFRRDGQLRIGRLGIWPASLLMLVALWRLRHQYDVIHVFQLTPLAAVAALAGKLAHKPVVIMIQSAGPSEDQRKRLRYRAALMTDSLDETSFPKIDGGNWVVSGDIYHFPRSALGGQALRHYVRRSGAFYQALSTRCRNDLIVHGYRPEQIIHIPGSVDTTRFRPAPERRPDPTQPQRAIVCVARLEYPKGVDVLLHAWGHMLRAPAAWRAHLRPRLCLVGDGALRPQMQRIAADLHIEDSVEFAGLRTDIVDLLQQSWGFVLPSRWEGMPNALLEGMACGLPCVATRVSGSEDIMSDGVNGLLVEPEQPVEMALALRRTIEDADLALRLGREARLTITREYQLDTIVDRWLRLYRDLLVYGKPLSSVVQPGEGDL